MEGVPEEPKRPLKPGCFRDVTDEIEAAGVEYLTNYLSPAWRIKSDMVSLLDDAEQGKLGENGVSAASRFHYRFVRIHPFCDGNGRMARALSALLLARKDPKALTLETPINKVLLDHREDYIGVLEYCDSLYEDLKEDAPEENKLQLCEVPFTLFYTNAYIIALRAQIESNNTRILELDPTATNGLVRLADAPPDLSLEGTKNEYARMLAGSAGL